MEEQPLRQAVFIELQPTNGKGYLVPGDAGRRHAGLHGRSKRATGWHVAPGDRVILEGKGRALLETVPSVLRMVRRPSLSGPSTIGTSKSQHEETNGRGPRNRNLMSAIKSAKFSLALTWFSVSAWHCV